MKTEEERWWEKERRDGREARRKREELGRGHEEVTEIDRM